MSESDLASQTSRTSWVRRSIDNFEYIELNAFLTYVNLSWDTIVAGILSPQPPALGRQGEAEGRPGGKTAG